MGNCLTLPKSEIYEFQREIEELADDEPAVSMEKAPSSVKWGREESEASLAMPLSNITLRVLSNPMKPEVIFPVRSGPLEPRKDVSSGRVPARRMDSYEIDNVEVYYTVPVAPSRKASVDRHPDTEVTSKSGPQVQE